MSLSVGKQVCMKNCTQEINQQTTRHLAMLQARVPLAFVVHFALRPGPVPLALPVDHRPRVRAAVRPGGAPPSPERANHF